VVNAAKGAALGTGTTVDYVIMGGEYDLLPNKTLSTVMDQNLHLVGGVSYTPEEEEFARKIQASFTYKVPDLHNAAKVDSMPKTQGELSGSTDVGDVSWAVPTVGLGTATWVPGTAAHSWQAVAAGGTDIGTKGMMVAAKTMALTCIDLFTQPALIEKATVEFNQAKGADFKYQSLIGDRKPAFNYRD
jgi:aminobenzoyl-glutamate utilization protein B